MRPANNNRRPAMSSTLRCLAVLELLAHEPYTASLGAISAHLGVPKATAHRVVSTLVEAGFVEQDQDNRQYRLTGRTLWIGTAYLRHSRIYNSSFGVMQDLAARIKECMVHLALCDGDAVLYLHTVGHPQALYLFADAGERRPIHATALGKVLLAHRPDADVCRIFDKGCKAYTKHTITSLPAMRRELKLIRERGYAVDNEEGVIGLRCVAAPIHNSRGEVIAAMSLSAAASVLTQENAAKYAHYIMQATLRVSVQFGYRPPTANLASLIAADG
jgi:DNA-binding IclR family transcriptional regulator